MYKQSSIHILETMNCWKNINIAQVHVNTITLNMCSLICKSTSITQSYQKINMVEYYFFTA